MGLLLRFLRHIVLSYMLSGKFVLNWKGRSCLFDGLKIYLRFYFCKSYLAFYVFLKLFLNIGWKKFDLKFLFILLHATDEILNDVPNSNKILALKLFDLFTEFSLLLSC